MGRGKHCMAVQSTPPTQTGRRPANPLLNHETSSAVGRRPKPSSACRLSSWPKETEGTPRNPFSLRESAIIQPAVETLMVSRLRPQQPRITMPNGRGSPCEGAIPSGQQTRHSRHATFWQPSLFLFSVPICCLLAPMQIFCFDDSVFICCFQWSPASLILVAEINRRKLEEIHVEAKIEALRMPTLRC